MRRHEVELSGHSFTGRVVAYGHYGRPVLVFPSEQGQAYDFENNGMVGAVADLIDAGRVKLYCVDSADRFTWSDTGVPTEERARRHGGYEAWVLEQVVPWMSADSGGAGEFVTSVAAWAASTRSTSPSSAPTSSR